MASYQDYLNLWTLQGEQVFIPVSVQYQNWYVESSHVSRYGTAAVVIHQYQFDNVYSERRDLLLVDLDAEAVRSSTQLLDIQGFPVQGLVPTGDGEGQFLLGTLSPTTLTVSLQPYDLTPGNMNTLSPVGTPVSVVLPDSLLPVLASGNARVSVAQDLGGNLDYLLVNAYSTAANSNVTTLYPISTTGQVGAAVGSVNGWLNDYFVNGDEIWLSVWNGNQSQYLAFDPAATGTKTSALSNQQFYDERELALDVGSVVRAEGLVVDLRALDIGIPADAAIWVDDERSVEFVNGGGLLIRAEIEPAAWLEAGWSMDYEHWILVSATDGSLIAHRAFSSGAGLLMHSIDDADDGAIYFQQINATGSFPALLQDVDQALSIHRIDVDSTTSSATLAALLRDSSLLTLADAQSGVDEVQAYSQAELSGSKYSATAPLPAEHLLVVEGYAPRIDGGSVAVGLIGDLNSDQDLGAFIAVSRPMTGSDPLVTSFVLPGEIIDSYYDPSVLPDSILAMVQSASGSFAVSVDLSTPGVAVIDEGLFAALAYQDDINNSEDVVTLELVFNDQSSLSLVIHSSELVSKLDVPDDTLDIVALTGKPLVVASSSDFVLAQFDYLDVNGVAGTLVARLAYDTLSSDWVVSDATVVPGQIAEYWSEFSSNGLDTVGLTLIDVGDTALQISSVRVGSAAITTEPIPTPVLTKPLSTLTLNLSEYATVTASFGAQSEPVIGTDGSESFNIAIVLRTYDPATPANQAAVEYRSLMFAVKEHMAGDEMSVTQIAVTQIGDTLGLRSLPSYQQSGIVGYQAAALFDEVPNKVAFIGTDGSSVQATVVRSALTAGLAAIDASVSTSVLSPRILEYNPETKTFVFALREFTDSSFTQQTGETYLVRLQWDGNTGSALTHLDTLLLPTGFSGNFTGVRLVPSEHDGSLYFALGQENGDQFIPYRAFEVDFGAGTVSQLATASDFLAVQADYYGEAPVVRYGTEGDDSLYTAVGGEALDGLGGNDLLHGSSGDDTLIGGPGNDLLWGGAGVDALDGGEGWDTALFEDATARVVIDLTRTSQQVQNDGFGNVETLVSIENLNGSAYGDIITLALDGSSVLGRAGDDVLNGAAGRQTFIGGSGYDNINGGDGDADRVSYFDDGYDSAGAATQGVSVDLSMDIGNGMVMAVANDGWGFTDTLTGIEEVQGSALADSLSGDSKANRLDGGLGDDLLRGRGGDDRLTGGGGSDYIVGGDGTDRIRYFAPQELAGDDIIGTNSFYAGEGTPEGGDTTSNDRIQLIGPGYYDFATASSVSYIDRVDLNADNGQFGVRLTAAMAASADANNNGSYGDIRVLGYGTASNSPVTTAQLLLDASALTTAQSVIVTGQDGSGDTTTPFGGLQGNDTLTGGQGNDYINAGKGDDRLTGGLGADSLFGGDGTDRIRYFNAQELTGDVISGTGSVYDGSGAPAGEQSTADRIQLFAPGSYDFATAASVSYMDRVDIGADTGQFAVRLTAAMVASADANSDGSYGDIRVVGWGGTDGMSPTQAQLFLNASALTTGQTLVVTGQDGSGVLDPGTAFGGLQGSDEITGGAGQDDIHSGLGDDTLRGGLGNDRLNGGSGFDTAVYSGNKADYTVTFNALNGMASVVDLRTTAVNEGSDTLFDIEQLQFADGAVPLTPPNTSPLSFEVLATANGIDVQVWLAAGVSTSTAVLQLDVQGGALQNVLIPNDWVWELDTLSDPLGSYLLSALGESVIGGGSPALLATLSFTPAVAAQALSVNLVDPYLGDDEVAAPAPLVVALKSAFEITTDVAAVVEGGPNGGSVVSFDLELDTALLTAQTLNWTIEGVGLHAASAADFAGGVLPGGTLSFAAGETRKTLTVALADDALVEQVEAFRLRVSGASAGLMLDANEVSPAVSITDDDVSVASISALTPGLIEGAGAASTSFSFKVTLNQAPLVQQSLSWSVSGQGTNAAQAADFVGGVLPQGVLTFAAGETEKLIQIAVLGDDVQEPDENFTVTLSAPSAGLELGNASAATASIRSDELLRADLDGQVLTRKGQALPDFEAELSLSTLPQLDLALMEETVATDGSRSLRFMLTVDSATQAFGAFNLELVSGPGTAIKGLALSTAFTGWQTLGNQPDAQTLVLGAFTNNLDQLSYPAGKVVLGTLEVELVAAHTGPVRIAVEELVLGTAAPTSGVLHYQTAADDGLGGFEFLALDDGQIDLDFTGNTAIIGRSITAQDALEALKLSVRLPSDYSDAYGLIAADYNQDGRVSSQDALEILKTSVRLPDAIQPQWVFLSDETDLSALSSRSTGYKTGLSLSSFPVDASHNFTAVLLGDVNDSLTFV